jgi:hypothetical protein
MRGSRRLLFGGASLLTGAVTVIVTAAALPGAAAIQAVSKTPAAGTPQLTAYNGKTADQVRQLVQCGGTMYAVGSFSSIKWNGTTYTRHNAFSFSATSPFTVTSWNPSVNGKVNTVAFNGSNCSIAYLGGNFSSVHGTAAKYFAAVSTSTGAVVGSIGHSASAQVETIVSRGGHLLVGGYFRSINGTARDYMAGLNPTTGRDDGFLHLHISGNYRYCAGRTVIKCAGSNLTRVYNQQLSHTAHTELVEGDFTTAGGKSRQQIFMLDLRGTSAVVTGWTSTEFNSHCTYSEPFYVRDASWSPDDKTIYTGTTGLHLYNWNKTFPLTGPCDAAIAYPSTWTNVKHKWINYTGCDSLYSSAADASTAYFGGHERWSQNPRACDSKGPGAIDAPGMEGLSPATGLLTFNPTRARGLGADDMLITSAGLWIASDNYNNASYCGGVSGHSGICFLPY